MTHFLVSPRLAPFARVRRLAALALLAAACGFGAYDVIVPYGKMYVARDAALAVSVDASTLWAVDQASTGAAYVPRLKVFDAATGNVVGSSWWGGNWAVRAIAPANEPGYEDVAWVLHQNGYRIRWNANLSGYSEIEAPIPTSGATAADSRLYCDFDQSGDGVQFLTTIDVVNGDAQSWLYREPTEAVWERVALPTINGKCGLVSWDVGTGDVFVLDDNTDTMLRFDGDTLGDMGVTDLPPVAGYRADFAVVGGHAVVAARSPGTGPDQLQLIDPEGLVLDTASLASANATYVHVSAEVIRAFWTGMDAADVKYTAGSWEIDPDA